mmetsp:Transcript_26332/g.46702  ORF Transcript_26332/g.46702 Transcript_26332/m.46702 type:complete len:593 (+) Transcript_26332:141-1919(+)
MPLISRAEDSLIKKALGKFQYPLAMTVAKLYLSEGKYWHDTGIWGALVLTIDRENKNLPHLLKILDLGTCETLFCQEIYPMLRYRIPQKDFHTFEIKGKVVGLRFADVEEAVVFNSRLQSRLRKLADDFTKQSLQTQQKTKPRASVLGAIKGWFGIKESKEDAHVAEIGRPENFKHNAHIGFDPEKGIDLDSLSPEWKQLFKRAGIRKKHLRNKTTAKAIFDKISSYGPNALKGPPPPLPPKVPIRRHSGKLTPKDSFKTTNAAPQLPPRKKSLSEGSKGQPRPPLPDFSSHLAEQSSSLAALPEEELAPPSQRHPSEESIAPIIPRSSLSTVESAPADPSCAEPEPVVQSKPPASSEMPPKDESSQPTPPIEEKKLPQNVAHEPPKTPPKLPTYIEPQSKLELPESKHEGLPSVTGVAKEIPPPVVPPVRDASNLPEQDIPVPPPAPAAPPAPPAPPIAPAPSASAVPEPPSNIPAPPPGLAPPPMLDDLPPPPDLNALMNTSNLKNHLKKGLNGLRPKSEASDSSDFPSPSANLAEQILNVKLKKAEIDDSPKLPQDDGMHGLRDALADMRRNFANDDFDDDESDEDWSE